MISRKLHIPFSRTTRVLALWFVSLSLFVVLLCVVVQQIVLYSTKGKIYSSVDSVSSAQAALILGARVYSSGKLSPMLEDRVLAGIELYQNGKVKKILLSGDHGRIGYDEVNAMREFIHATTPEIPEEDIFMDHAGFDTYDSIYRAQKIFLVENAIIVSQSFHLPRALMIAHFLGLPSEGFSADRREYATIAHSKRREFFALLKAYGDILFRSTPTYLGETIPITGDGKITRDE